jgi:hypothetical protein
LSIGGVRGETLEVPEYAHWMDQTQLIAHAERDPTAEGWGEPARWRRLVNTAREERGPGPVTASIWEILWRSHPDMTPPAWRHEGPLPPERRRGEPLNPFLPELSHDDAAIWVKRLAELDVTAAEFLASAIRAEAFIDWHLDEFALRQYASAWVETAKDSREGDERARERLFDDISEIHDDERWSIDLFGIEPPVSPHDVLEECEIRLTRLLLIGHGETTQHILPEFLALSSEGEGDDTTLLQAEELQLALSRLRPLERLSVGRAVLASLRSGELSRREKRPPEAIRVFERFGASSNLRRLALLITAGAAAPALHRMRLLRRPSSSSGGGRAGTAYGSHG